MMTYCNCMIFTCEYRLFVVFKRPGWYIYHGNGWKAVINALYFLSYFYATGRVGAWNATESSTLKKLNDYVQVKNFALAKGNKQHHS